MKRGKNMNQFTPDYQNIVLAARNKVAPRIPLYEHGISIGIMERITGQSFGSQFHGDFDDKCNFMRHYADFFRSMGYDTITFEQCIGPAMPGSGALGRHIQGVIRDRADFERYPWKEIPEMYFTAFAKNFDALHLETAFLNVYRTLWATQTCVILLLTIQICMRISSNGWVMSVWPFGHHS
jgi:uroporphyrinogen decarboxylase